MIVLNYIVLPLTWILTSVGLFGFPSKDVQYRFLSKFKPVFYIRQREYAKVSLPDVFQGFLCSLEYLFDA